MEYYNVLYKNIQNLNVYIEYTMHSKKKLQRIKDWSPFE